MTLAMLVGLMAFVLIVHVQTRPKNLFELSKTLPDPESNLGVRISIKRLMREGNNELAEVLKKYLVDENSRKQYMAHGNLAFTPLKNGNSSAEFVVKVLGPSVMWYPLALIVIMMVHFSRRGGSALWWGLLLLPIVAVSEVAEKNFEGGFRFQSLPFDTAYDSVEIIKLIAVCIFALITYAYSYTAEDRRMDAVQTARRIMKINDIVMKYE